MSNIKNLYIIINNKPSLIIECRARYDIDDNFISG